MSIPTTERTSELNHNIVFLPPLFSLLLRRECCSFSNGEYVKAGLQELENWCVRAAAEVNTYEKHFQIREDQLIGNK